jgi:hypothetical protein
MISVAYNSAYLFEACNVTTWQRDNVTTCNVQRDNVTTCNVERETCDSRMLYKVKSRFILMHFNYALIAFVCVFSRQVKIPRSGRYFRR